MTEQEKYDQIDRYLRSELSLEEQRTLERRMEADEEFSIEVALHREIAESIGGEKTAAFRQKLKTTNESWKMTEDKETDALIRKLKISRLIAVAATVAILIISTLYFSNNTSTNNTTDLFAQNFDSYPMLLNERAATEQSVNLKEAVKAYTTSEFLIAASAFKELSAIETDNVAYQFYEGVALLSSNQSERAAEILEPIIAKTDQPFSEQAHWYTALAYLKIGDLQKAKFYFSEIKEGAFKYAEAKNVLEVLE
ncbi:MAG: hypothetical protein AB8F74_23080 [Saprospiraceae bacterium]